MICDVSLSTTPPSLCPYLSYMAFLNPFPPFPPLISPFSQCQAFRPPLPLSLPHLFILSCILILHLSPTHPSLLRLTSSVFPCLQWNKSTSHEAASQLFLFFSCPFYYCNPFNLQPQQLIKHSNKTSVLPLFFYPPPPSVSAK